MRTNTKSTFLGDTSQWSGSFEIQNNLGINVSNLIMMHSVEIIGPTVGGPYSMVDDQTMPTTPLPFTTTSGESDWWYVSFLDVHGVLWTAQLQYDYHSSDAGSVVELSIGRNSDQDLGDFTVTIGGDSNTANFNQNH